MRIVQWLQSFSKRISVKLAIPMFVATILIGLVLHALFALYFTNSLQRNAVDMQFRTTEALQNSITVYMRGISNVLYNMAVDKSLKSDIMELNENAKEEHAIIYAAASSKLRTYAYFHSDLVGASFVTRDGIVIKYFKSGFRDDDLISLGSVGTSQEMRELAIKSTNTRIINLSNVCAIKKPFLLHAALAVNDFYSKEYLGTLIVTFDTSTLTGLIVNSLDNGESAAYNFLALGDGSAIAYPQKAGMPLKLDAAALERIGLSATDNKGTLAIPKDALVEWKQIPRTNIRLVSVVEQTKLLAGTRKTLRVVQGIVFAILVIFVLHQLWILRLFTASVRQLTAGIDKVQTGDLSVSLNIRSGDEIERLANAFNAMTAALHQADVEKEHQSKILFETEVKALESQIDSHFISNTLNAISYSAIEKNDYHTSGLLKILASSLRYTFDRAGQPVMVKEEVTWLGQYLTLQKERLGRAFDFNIDASPDVMEVPIRKLLIQPFIENSIVHGLSASHANGLLLVRLRLFKDSYLWISIQDNGRGMTLSQTQNIRQLFSGKEPDPIGIGIENVTTRIHSYYGDKSRLFIRSRAGEGTKIDILLPLLPSK